jgi:hypothetical protein
MSNNFEDLKILTKHAFLEHKIVVNDAHVEGLVFWN